VQRFTPKKEGNNFHLNLNEVVDGEKVSFGCFGIAPSPGFYSCSLPSINGLRILRNGEKFVLTWEDAMRLVSFFCLY
jgi:hypothetical protein